MRGQCTACNQVAHHAQVLGVGAATVLDWLHMPHSRDSVNLCNVLAANVRQPFAYLHWRTPQRVPETTSRMPASNQGHPRDATCIPAKEHMPARWDKISINPRDLQAVLFVKQLLAALSCKSKQQALVYAHYIGSATRRDPGNRRTWRYRATCTSLMSGLGTTSSMHPCCTDERHKHRTSHWCSLKCIRGT